MIIGKRPTTDEAIRVHLAHAHAENAKEPIHGPDQYGAFPGLWLNGLFQGEALLVVPDANVLRGDVGRASRTGRRTVLITAANSGALRLFCARHVLDEVVDRSEDWAAEFEVSPHTYLTCFAQEYLPLMRTIQEDELPDSLLAPPEAQRVKALGASFDVPSVVLSLVLGAFYLTEDRAARFAVYGVDAELEERRRWLWALMDGGDAAELAKVLFAVAAIPSAAVAGLANLWRSIAEKAPWALYRIAGMLGLLMFRTTRVTYKKMGLGLLDVSSFVADFYRPYFEAMDRFRQMAPAIPTWTELLQTNSRNSVRIRACVYTLARSPSSNLSALQLAEALPQLGVGKGTRLVREILRTNHCFAQPFLGRWQLGRAVHIP